jgi:hypothetical protein
MWSLFIRKEPAILTMTSGWLDAMLAMEKSELPE